MIFFSCLWCAVCFVSVADQKLVSCVLYVLAQLWKKLCIKTDVLHLGILNVTDDAARVLCWIGVEWAYILLL